MIPVWLGSKLIHTMKLFSEDLGSVSTDEGLVLLQQQFPAYDPGYITQAAGLPRRSSKEWMEKLWEQVEPYVDSHFVEDFKRQFAQRSWELYLGATLLNRGLKLGKHVKEGPDFSIQNNQEARLLWLEAVVPDKGTGSDRVPRIINDVLMDVPEDEMLFRISNSLSEKFKQYQARLTSGVVQDSEPYVIAINRSPLNYADPGLPLILKVLFGVGHQALRIAAENARREQAGSFWTARPKIKKQSGEDVAMLFFENLAHSGISAVIYCVDNILNSSRIAQAMGENFVIVHNPLAKNPLPDRFFPFGDEYRAGERFENGKKVRIVSMVFEP